MYLIYYFVDATKGWYSLILFGGYGVQQSKNGSGLGNNHHQSRLDGLFTRGIFSSFCSFFLQAGILFTRVSKYVDASSASNT